MFKVAFVGKSIGMFFLSFFLFFLFFFFLMSLGFVWGDIPIESKGAKVNIE